jgi:hypothetical protein
MLHGTRKSWYRAAISVAFEAETREGEENEERRTVLPPF